MVEVRFTGNPAEIRTEMAQLLGSGPTIQLAPPQISLPKMQAEDKPAAKTATEEKKSSKKEAAPAVEGGVTLDEAKAMIPTLIAKLSKDGLIKFFADNFAPAKKVSDLAPEQLPVFKAKADAALK